MRASGAQLWRANKHRQAFDARDMGRLQVGLFLFGLAVALMLEAHIGLDPWASLHEAISVRSGLSFGRVTQGIGLLLIVFSRLVLSVRPGIATICNMKSAPCRE